MLKLIYTPVENFLNSEAKEKYDSLFEKYPDVESRFNAIGNKTRFIDGENDLEEVFNSTYYGSTLIRKSLEDFNLFIRLLYSTHHKHLIPELLSFNSRDEKEYKATLEALVSFYETNLRYSQDRFFDTVLGSINSYVYDNLDYKHDSKIKRKEYPKLCHSWQDLFKIYKDNFHYINDDKNPIITYGSLISLIRYWRIITPAVVQEKIVEIFESVNSDPICKKFTIQNIWFLTQIGMQELRGFESEYKILENPGAWTYEMLEDSQRIKDIESF